MKPPFTLMAALMYGSGIRLNECLSLRHKDIDMEHQVLTVRQGKGDTDRYSAIPDAGKEISWFWVFPAPRESIDPRTHVVRRHHMYPSSLQKAFKRACGDVSTTMIYTHVAKRNKLGVTSPADAMKW